MENFELLEKIAALEEKVNEMEKTLRASTNWIVKASPILRALIDVIGLEVVNKDIWALEGDLKEKD